jgi:hypothetical protein
MARLMNTLTRLGVAVALVGGAANSMLYNGEVLKFLMKYFIFFDVCNFCLKSMVVIEL